MAEKLYRMAEASRLLGVHPNTIRRWDTSGKLRCAWTPGGKERRVPESEIRRLMGLSENTNAVALYGRIFGHDQGDDPSTSSGQALERQVKSLETEFAGRFGETYTFADVGSSLNPRRKGLRQVIELARARRIRAVAITSRDRLARFGFEYLQESLAAYGVEILILHPDDDQTTEQELVTEMLALVTSFAGQLYGRRSPKVRAIKRRLKKAVH